MLLYILFYILLIDRNCLLKFFLSDDNLDKKASADKENFFIVFGGSFDSSSI